MSQSTVYAFFPFVIALLIILLIVAIKRNETMDKNLDAMENSKKQLEEKITAANNSYQILHKEVHSFKVGTDCTLLKQALDDYESKLADVHKEKEHYQLTIEDSANAIRKGVNQQNMLLGGANDISAISLRNREKRFAELQCLSVRLIDGTELRIRAHALIEITLHMQKDNHNNLQ